jgi:hypothetical protein
MQYDRSQVLVMMFIATINGLFSINNTALLKHLPQIQSILQLTFRLPPILSIFIPEQPPQDLPRGTLKNDIDKLHPISQPFMLTLLPLDILADLASGHGLALLQPNAIRLDDMCLRYLTCAFIWHKDNGTVRDHGVVEQTGL